MSDSCSIDGCSTARYGRQPWCVKHYTRERRHGDPLVSKCDRSPDLLERLAARSATDGECHVWMARRSDAGYGAMRWRGGPRPTHRLMYEAHHGPIPSGMVVCHRCDNPPCIRLDHLFLGSPADNNRDRDAKGRQVATLGAESNLSVLTEPQVRSIRALYKSGRTQVSLAAEFGVTQTNISCIVRRTTWKHLD